MISVLKAAVLLLPQNAMGERRVAAYRTVETEVELSYASVGKRLGNTAVRSSHGLDRSSPFSNRSAPSIQRIVQRGQICGAFGNTEFLCNPEEKQLMCRDGVCIYVSPVTPPPKPVCILPWTAIRKASKAMTRQRFDLKKFAAAALNFEGGSDMAVAWGLLGSLKECGSVKIVGVKGRSTDAPFDVNIYSIEPQPSHWIVKMNVLDGNSDVCFEVEIKWYFLGSHLPGADALARNDMPTFGDNTPKVHVVDRHSVKTGGRCPTSGVTMGFVILSLGRFLGAKYVDNDDAAKDQACISTSTFPMYAPMMLLAHGYTFWSKPITTFRVDLGELKEGRPLSEYMEAVRRMPLEGDAARFVYGFLNDHVCSDNGYSDDALRSTNACLWARDQRPVGSITWQDAAVVFVHGFSTAGKKLMKSKGKTRDFCAALGEANLFIPMDFAFKSMGLHCYKELTPDDSYGAE